MRRKVVVHPHLEMAVAEYTGKARFLLAAFDASRAEHLLGTVNLAQNLFVLGVRRKSTRLVDRRELILHTHL